MLDPTKCDSTQLHLVDVVVTELLARSTQLRADDMMVVGARCRDILQSALGHDFSLRATTDIDLGLAVANWPAYEELTENLPTAGNTGIRYRVANGYADLMPFGPVEDPPGTVTPAARKAPMSVWGFAEVFERALPLALPGGSSIRIPTVAGYTALKLAAWLDRSANGEYKDASDIATAMYWYSKSVEVETYLYETEEGQGILLQEEYDSVAAAARLLGVDVAAVVGSTRMAELAARWPGSRKDLLFRHMGVLQVRDWPRSLDRRQGLVRAMEVGMAMDSAS